jgi:acetamidase/formamidase
MAHHTFIPQHYYTALGTYDPVLTVDAGDSISTTTVDARGRDGNGEIITERGNPMTGPFAVQGAEPGDTLVVTLDRLYPNRTYGWTATKIAPNVLEPGYVPQFNDDVDLAEWQVDFDKDTIRLVSPKSPLGNLALPLDPMVGCFGVAPPHGQAISTATSSNNGGNMDYRGFVQGVKVYFPVYAAGGLFFLGDGHAIQGDGEIVGTGVEISFDVTFTLDLIKNHPINWPRAENANYILTAGNARPLDQCVQHATTEMLAWLQTDYGLDARTAHLFLGQCVQYDMGNVFDPAYTMICKVAKDKLAALQD